MNINNERGTYLQAGRNLAEYIVKGIQEHLKY